MLIKGGGSAFRRGQLARPVSLSRRRRLELFDDDDDTSLLLLRLPSLTY